MASQNEKLLGTGIKISEPNEWQFLLLIGKDIKGTLKSKGWKNERVSAYYREADNSLIIRRL
jgi:hypothetical protein